MLDEVVVLLVLNFDSTIELATLNSSKPAKRMKDDHKRGTIATT